MKKIYFIIIISFLFVINSRSILAHTLAKDFPGIEPVSDGIETDSKYSFALRPNENTITQIWGYNGNVMHYYYDKFDLDKILIMPQDSALSGKIGCWFYNVGTYQGNNVDLKCTFYWEDNTYNGTKLCPTISFGVYEKQYISFYAYTTAFEVKYELYSNGKPINVNLGLTFAGIDHYQFVGFKTDGNVNKIQCRNDSIVYFNKISDCYWAYAGNTPSLPDSDLTTSIRVELDNVNSFSVIYGPEEDSISYPEFEHFYEEDKEVLKDKLKIKVEKMINQYNNNSSEIYEVNRCAGFTFNGEAYGPYTVVTPLEKVSDNDEKNVINNVLSISSEEFKYNIYQQVPVEKQNYYYQSLKIINDVPSVLDIKSVKIYNDASIDVTDKFNISIVNNKITIEAKNTLEASFYNATYRIEVSVKFIESNYKSDLDNVEYDSLNGKYTIKNNCKLVVQRNSKIEEYNSNLVTTEYNKKTSVIETVCIDKFSKEVLNKEDFNGFVGDNLSLSSKQISGYELVSEPLDKTVTFTENKITLTYEYVKVSTLNVKYIDINNKEIADSISIIFKQGESYNTEEKEIKNYELLTIPDNANGIMEDKDIEVTYIYDLIKGKVTVTKVDKNDNTKLLSGAVFKIEKMTEDNTIDDTFTPLEKTTDNNGKVEFTELIVGKYRVTEIKAPTGYELKSESIDIKITKEAREQNILATDRMKLNLPETGAINYSLLISILGLFIVSSVCIYKYKSKNKIN